MALESNQKLQNEWADPGGWKSGEELFKKLQCSRERGWNDANVLK